MTLVESPLCLKEISRENGYGRKVAPSPLLKSTYGATRTSEMGGSGVPNLFRLTKATAVIPRMKRMVRTRTVIKKHQDLRTWKLRVLLSRQHPTNCKPLPKALSNLTLSLSKNKPLICLTTKVSVPNLALLSLERKTSP